MPASAHSKITKLFNIITSLNFCILGGSWNLNFVLTDGSNKRAHLNPQKIILLLFDSLENSAMAHSFPAPYSDVFRRDLGKRKRNFSWDLSFYMEINEEDV